MMHSVLLVLVASLFVMQASGQPVQGDEDVCMENLNYMLASYFGGTPVVLDLIDQVRSQNPTSGDKTVTQLFEDQTSNLDLSHSLKDDQKSEWADFCTYFKESVKDAMLKESCGRRLIELSEGNKAQFYEELEKNPGVDHSYGFAQGCLQMYSHV